MLTVFQQCCGKIGWVSPWLQTLSVAWNISVPITRWVTTSISHILQGSYNVNTTKYANLYTTNLLMKFCLDPENLWWIAGEKWLCLPAFLLTPFCDAQEHQQAYNHAHDSTKTKTEMAFELRVNPLRACDIIVVRAGLHNVACLRKEKAPRMLS